jgi:hypothetical protein
MMSIELLRLLQIGIHRFELQNDVFGYTRMLGKREVQMPAFIPLRSCNRQLVVHFGSLVVYSDSA